MSLASTDRQPPIPSGSWVSVPCWEPQSKSGEDEVQWDGAEARCEVATDMYSVVGFNHHRSHIFTSPKIETGKGWKIIFSRSPDPFLLVFSSLCLSFSFSFLPLFFSTPRSVGSFPDHS